MLAFEHFIATVTVSVSDTREQNKCIQKLQEKLPKTQSTDYFLQPKNSLSELYPQKLVLGEKLHWQDNSTQNHETTAAYAKTL